MNTSILTRLSISVSLLYSLSACSDSTQFAEKTLAANALDAAKPAETETDTTATETDTSTSPSGEVVNEDNPTGVSNPDDSSNPDGGSTSGSGTDGSSSGGSSSGGSGGSGSGGSGSGSTGSGNDVFTACSNEPDRAIVSQLYKIPDGTSKLPDFSTMTSLGDVCVAQLNIADRDFTQGFPGVSDIFEWFALDMHFKLTIATAGTYKFYLNSDDGSILSIDGADVVNNDGTHSQQEKTGSVYLGAGVHDVQLRYYQGPRTRIALELFWKVPGSSNKVYVPASVMSRP